MANNNSSTSNPSGNPNFTTGLRRGCADQRLHRRRQCGGGFLPGWRQQHHRHAQLRQPVAQPRRVEEFRVETSAFGAQYGQFSAAVVSVITKSGTNQFHGGLFEFNRNTDFNANTWAPAQNATADQVRLTTATNLAVTSAGRSSRTRPSSSSAMAVCARYGSAVYRRHRAHGRRAPGRLYRGHLHGLHPPAQPRTVRAANQVDGTNSSPNCLVATLNCIPPALLDTTISNIDNVGNTIGSSIPLPNGALKPAKGGGAYAGLYPIPTTENEYLGKYDQNLGDKDHVTATYFFSRNVLGPNAGGNVPWTINQTASNGTNINLSDVHTFSPTTANQAWLTFTRAAGGRVNLPCPARRRRPSHRTARTFSSRDRSHCPISHHPGPFRRPRPMQVRSRVLTTMNCATWSA